MFEVNDKGFDTESTQFFNISTVFRNNLQTETQTFMKSKREMEKNSSSLNQFEMTLTFTIYHPSNLYFLHWSYTNIASYNMLFHVLDVWTQLQIGFKEKMGPEHSSVCFWKYLN